MKRWIVFGLVALAVVVLVSPGIVGRLAERNLAQGIVLAERENDGLVVTEEKFRRGWFTAEGRHRVALRNGRFAPADDARSGETALIIETRIDHGLVPVTSMSRDAGSLQPALASTLSTLSLDLGEGRVIGLPGHLYSRFGLTGATDSHYALEEGSFRDTNLDLRWRGADVHLRIDAAASSMRYEGRIEPVRWAAAGTTAGLGVIGFDGEQRKTGYGFSTGELKLEVSAASVARAAGDTLGFGRLSLAADSRLEDTRVHGVATLEVEALLCAGLGPLDLDLEVAIEGLDATSVQRLRETVAAVRETAAADDSGAIHPLIERDLRSLLGAGAALHVTRLELSLPQGAAAADLHFELPRTDARDPSWPTLLLALRASADVRVPAALVEMARAANPQAGSLIAMGILQRDGDAWVVDAEYAGGLVTVNGAPMPLPLPGGRGQTSATD